MKKLTVVLLVCFSVSSMYAQNVVSLKNEGDKAMGAKQYVIALTKYEKALAVWGKKPVDNAMIFSMGECAYRVNDMKKSLMYIDQSIIAGYNLDMDYQYRACIMKAQKNTEGYLKTLKEGLVKVPGSKALKETLSKYYFDEGDKHYHEACDIMKKASEQMKGGKFSSSDKAFKVQNDKAKLDFNEALKYLNMALGLTPNDEHAKKVKSNCTNQLQMLI